MTRRLTILALFLTTWLGLGSLEVAGNQLLGGLELATTALALLAAFVAGDLVERLGLPAITGYMIAGILVGPVTHLLGGALLWDLLVLERSALAVLVFCAGAQLDLHTPRRLARPSIGATLMTSAVTLVGVSGVAWLAAPLHASVVLTPSVALLFGALAIGTSPAIVGWIGATAEHSSHMAALGLATTLGRALLVIVAASVILGALGVPWSDALVALVASPLAAVALSLTLRAAAPRLDRRAALPILVILSATLPVLETVGAEPVITLALAGVMTRRWLPETSGETLNAGLADLRLPAALVLFTLTGATLPLPDPGLAFFVAVLFVTRAASLWLGNAIAGRWSNAPSAFRAHGWLMLLPQGELTLGALATVVALAPDVTDAIQSPVLGMVALGLLLGPITCRVALRRAGEQGGQPDAPTKAAAEPLDMTLAGEPEHPWRDPMAALVGPDDDGPRAAWGGTVQGLVLLRSRVREQSVGARLDRIAKAHKAAATHARQIVQNTAEAAARSDDREVRRRHLYEARTLLAEAVRTELEPLLTDTEEGMAPGLIEVLAEGMDHVVRASPTLLEAVETERHIVFAADDPRWVRVGKVGKRLTRALQGFLGRARPTREIPFRRLVRRTLAGEMLAALGPVEAMVSRAEYKALRRLEAHVNRTDRVLVEAVTRDDSDAESLRLWLQERVADLREASKDAQADIAFLAEEPLHRVSEAMARGLNRLAYITDIAGTFALPESAIRYAPAAPRVRAAIAFAEEERSAWSRRKRAQIARIQLDLQLAELQVGLRDLALDRALGPAVRMHTRVQALMVLARDMVRGARDDATSGATPANAEAEGSAVEALLADLQRRVGRPLEGLINGLRSGAVIDRLIGALETATAELPEVVDLLPEASILALERGRSSTEEPMAVRVRDVARAFFDRRVAVSLAEHSRALETSAEEARAGVRDAQRLLSVHIARAAAAHATTNGDHGPGEGDEDESVHRLTLEALQAVLERMTHEVSQTTETSAALMHEIAKTEADAVRELWAHLHSVAVKPPLDQAVTGLWRWVREATERALSDRRVVALRRLVAAIRHRVRVTQQVVEARADTSLGGPARVREALRSLDPSQRDMPYVYGKLFALTPTENDAFVLGRERELAVLRENVQTRQHGAAIVLGERGSGRSSLVRVALAETGRERPVIWLDTGASLASPDAVVQWAARAVGMTEATPSLDAVASEIRQRAPVMVLDGLEALFVRSAMGLEAIHALMNLIVDTDRQALWLATCERHMWRLLTAVTPLDDAFDVTVDLRALSPEALREAIERRHRLSGLDTTFARPRGLDLRGWLAHLWGTSPADRTFRHLAEVSRGNPRVAMQLWQLVLTHHENDRTVEVAANGSTSLAELQALPSHLTPAIALLFHQGVVDGASMEVGLGWSPAEVRAAVHALELAGLVESRIRPDGGHGLAITLHACEPVSLFLLDHGLVRRQRRLG